MWFQGRHQKRRFWYTTYGYRHMVFQLVVIVVIFVGCSVSITHAQNQNPPNVTDPNSQSSVAVPAGSGDAPQVAPSNNQVVDPALVTGLADVTTDMADANAANQALALLAAGTGLAVGVGMARGGSAPVAPSGPFTWPVWARPVSQQIMNQSPAFWQRLLRTGQAWLTMETHLSVQGDAIVLQRVEGGRVLAQQPIATIQPGGMVFHWQTAETETPTPTPVPTPTVPNLTPMATPTTPSSTVLPPAPTPDPQPAPTVTLTQAPPTATPTEPLADQLSSINDPYERFLLVQEQQPSLITNQSYPTTEYGDHAHILMDTPTSEVMTGSKVDYGFNLGNVLYDLDDPPRIRSFVINDPAAVDEAGIPVRVLGTDDTDGLWEDAHWTVPGTHTLVYEVQYSGQPPQYYTFQQTVVEPEELATRQLQQQPTPLNAELYVLSLQTMLQEVEQQEGVDEDQLEQFRESVTNAETLLAEGGTPIQAVLVADETSQALPLTLFLQQTEDGYAIIDLTNPHPDAARTYEGDSIESAWEDFLRNNTLPAGQIAATPPDGVDATTELWNAHSDGQSTLQQWSSGLGIFSLVALGAGVVLMFVPGGQIPGGVIIGAMGASAGAGALSAGLSMADRAHHGNLTWNTQTQLELLDLAGSLLVGGALARAGTQLSIREVGRMGVALEIVETGTDVTSAILLTNEYYQQIETIRNSDLSELQKQEAIREVLTSAAQLGGLVVLGVGLSQIDFSRIRGAVDLPDVPSGLRDTINGSPVLQRILADQNYDPAILQGLWQTWRRMPGHVPTDFAVWVQNLQRSGISLDVANRFFSNPEVSRRLWEQPDLMPQLAAHPEFMELALSNPTMIRRLLDRPGVSPVVPVAPTVWREEAAQFRQTAIEQFAQQQGLTVAEYQAAVNIHLQNLIDQSGVYKRVSLGHLGSILQDGRFKTLFETGTSGGTTNTFYRNNTEVNAIGFDEQLQPVEQRPQYGYLSQDPNGLGPEVEQYGDVTVVLRPDIRQRSTFTFGDSLNATKRGETPTLVPEPLTAPTYEAIDYVYSGKWYVPEPIDPLTITSLDTFDPYVEVHIHGGLQVSDIEELIFDTMPSNHIVAELNRLGISWRVNP